MGRRDMRISGTSIRRAICSLVFSLESGDIVVVLLACARRFFLMD
jgi:hypothetical protein